jgi:RNase adapter protein RapZ
MTTRVPVVLVTGLSGAGKASILRALEDIGFEAVDNPPLGMIGALAREGGARRLAIGVDARSRGFDAGAVLAALATLREDPALWPQLIYAWADDAVLLRRYTETRRRHPLALLGQVADGIAEEQRITAALHEAADLVIDTSDLPLSELRQQIEARYAQAPGEEPAPSLALTLVSFAYPAGLPREADLVFDARFLRNPHYNLNLRPLTGLDPAVGAYVEEDSDFAPFLGYVTALLALLLPRFIREGKKYVTIGVGCTGGRHRSVHIVETLAKNLAGQGWRVNTRHRELAREGAAPQRATAHHGIA